VVYFSSIDKIESSLTKAYYKVHKQIACVLLIIELTVNFFSVLLHSFSSKATF